MSGRRLNDWITTYLEYSENTEPKKSYHLWTAVSVIAGALQRRVYIKWGHESIYPNLYIVLVGRSGRTRKGTAMTIGIDLFNQLNFPVTAESITREQLIRTMKLAVNSFEDPGKIPPIKYHCSITTFSKELAVFLGNKDIRFLADLNDWYDSHDSWRYGTKGAGIDHIKGVVYNLLGATAPDWIQSMIPLEAVGGGFTARIIFIVETNKKVVAFPSVAEELRQPLIADLERIATISGEYTLAPETLDAYEEWYTNDEKNMQNGIMPVEDPRLASYCDRRATHVKKIAMVVTASRTHERVIELDDFRRALLIMQSAEVKMSEVFGGLGKAKTGELAFMLLQYIKERGKVTRREIMRRFYTDITTFELEEVEKILQYMGVIEIEQVSGKGGRTYHYKEKAKTP